TNDMSYVLEDKDRREEYINGYIEFLKKVRKNNPMAQILCTLGIMGEALCPAVKETVERYEKETGDVKVSYMGFHDQLPEDGYVADWHPTEKTHTKAAEKLTEEIRRIMSR
ncbi:MAG: GDSL family lipase, partial [Lachnospiraceae bacterium]|nr:GDSL family lipase [Lachnospiraceae bacterium]